MGWVCRWSSDTSQRSMEEIQALNTRASSGGISDSALALPRASPDKSRLKERIRWVPHLEPSFQSLLVMRSYARSNNQPSKLGPS